MDAKQRVAPARTAHFSNAEGIRGLACLIVLSGHGIAMFFPAAGHSLLGVGRFGVWLFFVLSAFLLTNHLLLERLTGARLIDYAVGRVLRIMPLYLLAIVVYWWLGTTGIHTWRDVFRAATLSAGYAHLWTIPVEMKFYVLLGTLIAPIAWIRQRLGLGLAVALAIGIGLLAIPLFPPSLAYTRITGLGWYVPCFMAGVALSLAYPSLPRPRSWIAASVSAAILAGMVAITNSVRVLYGGDPSPYWPFDKFVWISVAWTVLVSLNVDRRGLISRFWQTAPLRLVGRWSYPIYLFHWLVLMKFAHGYPGSASALAIAVTITIVFAAVCHKLVERPTMKLRPRISRLLERMAIPQSLPQRQAQ